MASFMSWFGLFNRETFEYRFVVSAMLKTPALFALTLLVTFPSLYVFNALVGSRLTVRSLLNLLVAALGVTLAVLASFGPIVAFFSVTTSSYPFMGLLNVAVFAVSGILGLNFLLQAAASTHSMTHPELPDVLDAETRADFVESASTIEMFSLAAAMLKTVFYCWIIVFSLVGADELGVAAIHRRSRPTVRMVSPAAIAFLRSSFASLPTSIHVGEQHASLAPPSRQPASRPISTGIGQVSLDDAPACGSPLRGRDGELRNRPKESASPANHLLWPLKTLTSF